MRIFAGEYPANHVREVLLDGQVIRGVLMADEEAGSCVAWPSTATAG